ncbi:MAG: hypothetical protein EBT77_06715 [Verrucomicrobia bacterium]|nr:hypothetical protein [Verrucomicrobiota bacterium]
MGLKVHSRVPRKAPGGKTQERKNILPGGAGKPAMKRPRKTAEACWPSPRGGEDPWAGAKAGRWLPPSGQAVVRAGLLAWQGLGARETGAPRERAILVAGVEGCWPDWLSGKSPGDVAAGWRGRPPLWLLGCLPNLPAAQLAIEIGACGPVESRRSRADDGAMVKRALRRWQRRGVRTVLVVRLAGETAKAEVWSL